MPILNINGTDYEARVDFKFNSLAKEKYYGEDREGNKTSGINNIYEKLLNYDNEGLIGFWDCGLFRLKEKERPKTYEIEEALMEVFEGSEDGAEKLFKDCFNALDQSGFFKLQAKKYWRNLEKAPELAKNDEEKEQMKKYVKQMKESKAEMTA